MVGLKVKKGQAVVCFWKHACGVVLHNIFFSTVHVDIEDKLQVLLTWQLCQDCMSKFTCRMHDLTANLQLLVFFS